MWNALLNFVTVCMQVTPSRVAPYETSMKIWFGAPSHGDYSITSPSTYVHTTDAGSCLKRNSTEVPEFQKCGET